MVIRRNIKEAIGDDDTIRAWVGNLGKYNEGELVGEWIDLPISKADYDAMLKRIGIGSADDFGNPYEETFVADYDDPYGFVYDQFGEYPNMIELNAMAKAIEDMKSKRVLDEFNAMIETGNWDFWGCVGNALDMTCYLVDGDDWSDLARYYIDEVDGGVENLPQEEIENNFDYDALGRDLSFDSYEDDDGNDISAGMYWCGDDDATDQEIGEAYVEAVGFEGVANPENYFDYDSYGHDFQYDEYEITDEGILAYYDFDSSLGDDYREQYEEEIRNDWDIEEESLKRPVQESFLDNLTKQDLLDMMSDTLEYKGYMIEPSMFSDGFTVNYAGDEIICDTVEDAKKTIDELIEFDKTQYN